MESVLGRVFVVASRCYKLSCCFGFSRSTNLNTACTMEEVVSQLKTGVSMGLCEEVIDHVVRYTLSPSTKVPVR